MFLTTALTKCKCYKEHCYSKVEILTMPDILVKNPKFLKFFLTFCCVSEFLAIPDIHDSVAIMTINQF